MEFSAREVTDRVVMPEITEQDAQSEQVSKPKKKLTQSSSKERRLDDNWSYEDSLRHWGIELN